MYTYMLEWNQILPTRQNQMLSNRWSLQSILYSALHVEYLGVMGLLAWVFPTWWTCPSYTYIMDMYVQVHIRSQELYCIRVFDNIQPLLRRWNKNRNACLHCLFKLYVRTCTTSVLGSGSVFSCSSSTMSYFIFFYVVAVYSNDYPLWNKLGGGGATC